MRGIACDAARGIAVVILPRLRYAVLIRVPTRVDVLPPKLAEHGGASRTYNDGWGVGYY